MERNQTWRFRVLGFLGIKRVGGLWFGIYKYQHIALLCSFIMFTSLLIFLSYFYLLDRGVGKKMGGIGMGERKEMNE